MRITSIEMRNFRSVGPEPVIIKPERNLNVIVGPNNVGKTNIAMALHLSRESLCDRYDFIDTDWYMRRWGSGIEIHVQFALDEDESGRLLDVLIERCPDVSENANKLAELRKALSGEVEMVASYGKKGRNEEAKYLRLGFLYVYPAYARLDPRYFNTIIQVPWMEILAEFVQDDSNRGFQEFVQHKLKDINQVVIFEDRRVWDTLVGLVDTNLRVFPEIRRKPSAEHSALLESYGGEEIPSVLLNLSTSESAEERDKYDEIKRKFSLLFPGLELVSVRDKQKGAPCVHVIIRRKPHFEVPLESTGTGIIEMVIFLTNLIGSRQRIFVVEEPELHLHPHAQRLLLEVFREHQTDNQLFVITHSPYFIDSRDVENQVIVKMENGMTKATQLPSCYFSKEEKAKLAASLSRLDNRELMFSNSVLLVEGDTERGGMPILAETLAIDVTTDKNTSFDKNSVSTVAVGGKDGFGLFIKLLTGIEIPYQVMCDADAILEITAHIPHNEGSIDTSSLFAQLAQLGILDEADLAVLRDSGKLIESQRTRSGTKRSYPRSLFKELKAIAEKHDCVVLDSDFLGVIKSVGHKGLIEEAKREVGARSDARIGTWVANRIRGEEIPAAFIASIEKVVGKARRRVQCQVANT